MRWIESIIIDAPVAHVYQAVADENEVLRWSAWPASTGFTCAIAGDGTTVGSEIRYTDPRRDRAMGAQRLVAAEPPTRVSYQLDNRGPFGRRLRPTVEFRLTDLGGRTRTELLFDLPIPRPVELFARATGFARRIRGLHREDLRLLAEHVRPVPHPEPTPGS